jgi:tetratricopeptide (TPR) repeat protein
MPTSNTPRRVFVRKTHFFCNSQIKPRFPEWIRQAHHERTAIMSRHILCIIVILLVVSIVKPLPANAVQEETNPSSLDIGSKKSQIVSFIAAGNLSEADSAVAGIMEMPASREKGHTLQQIAGAYQQAKQYDRAITLCDYVLKNWPNEDFAVWAGMSMALSQMDKGDMKAVEKTTERIVNDCAGDVNLPWVLSIIADGYAANKMDDKARHLREVAIDKSPESIWGAEAQILSLINQRGYSVAQKRLNSMIADFNGNPNLSGMVFRIGQEFCWKHRYAEANNVFQLSAERCTLNAEKDKARLWAACAVTCNLVRQGQDEEAAKALKKMNADFLNNPGLAEAMYQVGRELEWCKGEKGAGSRAFVAATETYKRIIQQFSSTSTGKQADWDSRRLELRVAVLDAVENNSPGAEAAVDKMASELAGRPELADELSWIAAWCNDHKKYEMVDKLDKRIMTGYPNTDASVQSLWRIVTAIVTKNEDANDAVSQINKRFADTSNILPALIIAGQIYQQKAEGLPEADQKPYLEKAIRLFTETVQTAQSPTTATAGTYLQLADCYQKLRRFSDALACYEKIKGKWPDSLLEKQCLMGIQMCNIEIRREKENDYVK